MLYYGNARNIQDQCQVFNFTSYIEGYRRLDLIPPNSLGASTEFEFDVLYMQYIMGDDYKFFQMFTIVEMLHSGIDVYIIISDDEWSENLIESFLKLLQQRYGYNAVRVNCFEDIIYTVECQLDPSYGLFNYDQDTERYEYIVQQITGGNNYGISGFF